MDEKFEMSKEIVQDCIDNGIMVIEISGKYCGPGSSSFDSIIVIEDLSKVDASLPKEQVLQCFCSSYPHSKISGSKSASFHYSLWITNCYEDKEPWNTMDADTITFLRMILTDDVEARATIQQVKDDPWLAVEEEATSSLKRKAIENERSTDDEQVESCTTEKRQRLEISSETSSE
ncbi:hypothetical protein CAEBREN_04698 [Caenorhabditis brenneri]|uniref:Acyl-CoA dehydrogenase/oxidase N-terminal domain-containing protein n=1 Tax=Caenorhabditis brenneri TaxID=135651 RepID=G0NWJ9_CAEBE|nr:hypothetical protein CAEBREN_04698 [Caenorhabditis brenneri]